VQTAHYAICKSHTIALMQKLNSAIVGVTETKVGFTSTDGLKN
jgi:hypothetical protein